jgi:hypothetical protein
MCPWLTYERMLKKQAPFPSNPLGLRDGIGTRRLRIHSETLNKRRWQHQACANATMPRPGYPETDVG